MPKTSLGSPGTVRVYAHNPSPLMTKSTAGRKTTTARKKPAARRAPAKKAPARRRRNPAPASRRNPSFASRATSAYSKAGGVVLGGVAAEQAKNMLDKFGAARLPAGDVVSSLAPGVLGVYLMGNKSELAKNLGLGMVATSAANTLGTLIGKIGGGGTATGTTTGAAPRGLAAPRTRSLSAPQAGCGCSTGSSQWETAGVRIPDGF